MSVTGKTGFLVFAGSTYYPRQGVVDLIGYPTDIAGARKMAKEAIESNKDWWQIVDHATMLLVESFDTPDYGGEGHRVHIAL